MHSENDSCNLKGNSKKYRSSWCAGNNYLQMNELLRSGNRGGAKKTYYVRNMRREMIVQVLNKSQWKRKNVKEVRWNSVQ